MILYSGSSGTVSQLAFAVVYTHNCDRLCDCSRSCMCTSLYALRKGGRMTHVLSEKGDCVRLSFNIIPYIHHYISPSSNNCLSHLEIYVYFLWFRHTSLRIYMYIYVDFYSIPKQVSCSIQGNKTIPASRFMF